MTGGSIAWYRTASRSTRAFLLGARIVSRRADIALIRPCCRSPADRTGPHRNAFIVLIHDLHQRYHSFHDRNPVVRHTELICVCWEGENETAGTDR
jgi:hypothetical protein